MLQTTIDRCKKISSSKQFKFHRNWYGSRLNCDLLHPRWILDGHSIECSSIHLFNLKVPHIHSDFSIIVFKETYKYGLILQVWVEISKEMASKGWIFTPNQIDNKFKGLKRTYKTIKDNNSKTGRARKSWEYFEVKIHTIFITVQEFIFKLSESFPWHILLSWFPSTTNYVLLQTMIYY